eukprot:Amastigsp_a175476_23.p2 type:complete len:263 gc:universal Amastigsp_a175476_23:916-128(-)
MRRGELVLEVLVDLDRPEDGEELLANTHIGQDAVLVRLEPAEEQIETARLQIVNEPVQKRSRRELFFDCGQQSQLALRALLGLHEVRVQKLFPEPFEAHRVVALARRLPISAVVHFSRARNRPRLALKPDGLCEPGRLELAVVFVRVAPAAPRLATFIVVVVVVVIVSALGLNERLRIGLDTPAKAAQPHRSEQRRMALHERHQVRDNEIGLVGTEERIDDRSATSGAIVRLGRVRCFGLHLHANRVHGRSRSSIRSNRCAR